MLRKILTDSLLTLCSGLNNFFTRKGAGFESWFVHGYIVSIFQCEILSPYKFHIFWGSISFLWFQNKKIVWSNAAEFSFNKIFLCLSKLFYKKTFFWMLYTCLKYKIIVNSCNILYNKYTTYINIYLIDCINNSMCK